jgi:hypothetical protein
LIYIYEYHIHIDNIVNLSMKTSELLIHMRGRKIIFIKKIPQNFKTSSSYNLGKSLVKYIGLILLV